ncbi:hypothetical protein ACFU96_47380 [Streptomyces sp. NPDC057620]|uniref:hypothetical protein n=1 Tax=Streptomyces sp. NPDC057620 TaxID=3346185 RepID=UPI00368FFBEC
MPEPEFEKMAPEILEAIVGFMEPRTAAKLRETSKTMKKATDDFYERLMERGDIRDSNSKPVHTTVPDVLKNLDSGMYRKLTTPLDAMLKEIQDQAEQKNDWDGATDIARTAGWLIYWDQIKGPTDGGALDRLEMTRISFKWLEEGKYLHLDETTPFTSAEEDILERASQWANASGILKPPAS